MKIDKVKSNLFYREYKLGIFHLSIYILKKKFSIRLSIEKGWE